MECPRDSAFKINTDQTLQWSANQQRLAPPKTHLPVNVVAFDMGDPKIRTRLGDISFILLNRIVIRVMSAMRILPGEIRGPKNCVSEEANDVTDCPARRKRAVSCLMCRKQQRERTRTCMFDQCSCPSSIDPQILTEIELRSRHGRLTYLVSDNPETSHS